MSFDPRNLPPKYQRQILNQLSQSRNREPKYHNLKTVRVVDGREIKFDSRKEAERFDVLLALQHCGKITSLRLQQDFTLIEAFTKPTGERVRALRYRADFTYIQDGETVVEDVKGVQTQEYITKKKLMYEKYGIEVKEL